MKKILIALTATACMFSFGVALADDAAALYKSHCQGCHGADGSRVPPNAAAAIKGQKPEETVRMLNGYKDGSFGGKSKQVMTGVAKRLSDDQVKILAGYISKM